MSTVHRAVDPGYLGAVTAKFIAYDLERFSRGLTSEKELGRNLEQLRGVLHGWMSGRAQRGHENLAAFTAWLARHPSPAVAGVTPALVARAGSDSWKELVFAAVRAAMPG